MINKSYICINGIYYREINDINSPPIPGKKIAVNGKPLEIRCTLRHIGENETNLYIDLIDEEENEKD